ncbi:uncharacterized protein LOC110042677 [Orbicella faveolata]|uniref:uncharacterized protein LOC110042677 n=1 Tax=Orbicella faveolata TaxID=48498 RepID=UPI0009E48D34|nr:uncharacterized protein LOC110042677 [Orbicella faveolata]
MSYKEANDVLNYWLGGGDRSKRPRWFGGGEEAAQELRDKFGTLVEKARNDELKHWENDPKATLALIILQDQFLRTLYKGSPVATSRDLYCQELAQKFIQRETHDHLKFSPAARLFLYLPLEHSEDRGKQGSPVAFSRDLHCQVLAQKFIQRETHDHLKFSPAARIFIYLPIEHSEDRDKQELNVQLFAQLEKDTKGTEEESSVKKIALVCWSELSVQLFAQLENDTKGSEEEAFGKGGYRFACLHKEVVDRFGRFPQRNKVLGRENTPEEEDWLNNLPNKYKW